MAEKIVKSISWIVTLVLIGTLVVTMISFFPESTRGFDDSVSAWASVGTSISCNVIPDALAFGTLTTGLVSEATDTATTTLTSNTTAFIKIYDWGDSPNATSGLYAATSTPSYNIQSAGNGRATSTLVASTGEGYGLRAATTTAGSGAEMELGERYKTWYLDQFSSDAVGGLVYGTSSAIVIASSSATVTGREVVVSHKAAISASASAGDYKDTILYICSTSL